MQDPITLVQTEKCFNCKHEKVHLKQKPCSECLRFGTAEKRFPKWEKEEE